MRMWRPLLAVSVLSILLAGCPPPNTPPTADAGPDQTVALGDMVTLDGSGSSDPDGGALSYQWQFIVRPAGSLAVLSGAGTTMPRFTADRPGTYSLRLRVTDAAGGSAIESVVITVTGALASVPDLRGMTEAEAEAALASVGLVKGDVSMESSGAVPQGQVIRHEPDAGAEVLPGSPVNLVLSTGPGAVTVPDVTGLPRTAAEAAIAGAGLQTGSVAFENSDTVPQDSIIRTEPEAGAEVDEGSAVNLVVSLGPESGNQVAVPDVTGQTRAEAETAIAAAGLTVGDVTAENSETVAAGLAIRTAPEAGAIVGLGSPVDLVLSLGPATGILVDVPDLAGLTQAEVETALAGVGLNLGTVQQAPDGAATPGTVIAQAPEAGASVSEGAFVAITIAFAPLDIQLESSQDIRGALGDPGAGNVLRPDAMAADSATGEIFIAALLSPHIAIYDTALAAITATIETNFVLPGEKRLFLAPGGPALYVYDTATRTLARIDRESGLETANTPVDGAFTDLEVDAAGDRLYLARRESPAFVTLDGSTLAQLGTSTRLDGVAGDLLWDAAESRLLVLDTTLEDAAGTLRIYDPDTDSIIASNLFDMPGSGATIARQFDFDAGSQRVFLRTDSALGVFDISGANPRALLIPSQMRSTSMVYDPGSNRLVTVALSLQSAGSIDRREATLFAFNPDLGQNTAPQATIPLGELNRHLALDTSTNTILSTDHATGTVWVLGTSPFPDNANPIELGAGIDQIALAGGRLYGTSRFANNTLFHFTPGAPTVSPFTAGAWPAPFAIATEGDDAPVLVVANAWDSTLSRLSTGPNPTLLDTLDTGFSIGTTERMPDLALSPDGSQIAIAYPEFARVAVLDASDGSPLTTIEVPNFDSGAEPAGKGQLQVLYDQSGAGYLFVLDRIGEILHRYDAANGFTSLSTANLAGRLPDMDDAPESGWLFQDLEAEVLFVGPVRVNPDTGVAAGDLLPDTHVVLGIDTLFNLYWTVEQTATSTGFATVIRTINRTGNTVAEAELALPRNHPITPEFAFDTENRRFHIAYPDTAVVESYAY